jgi:hypothetical protein
MLHSWLLSTAGGDVVDSAATPSQEVNVQTEQLFSTIAPCPAQWLHSSERNSL